MEKPSISVITPAYNMELYISETITSVLSQTFTDFEYLIINDGSTDNTLKIAKSFALQDSRIRIISQPNGGLAAACNTGVKNAQGEYISFVDADDMWNPNKLMVQLQQIQSLPKEFGAVFCWSELVDPKSKPIGRKQMPSVGAYNSFSLLKDNCPPGNRSCLLIRKQCFTEVGLFDEKISGADDFEMWLRITCNSQYPYFYGFSDVLAMYRVGEGRISSQKQKMLDRVEIILNKYTAKLTAKEKSIVYVKPTLQAFRVGDERALEWSRIAMASGWWNLGCSTEGRYFLLWSLLGKNRIRRVKQWLRKS
ncbi:MAG: glycosyltransferase [Nostoc indistinguendum CM1-VF10]|jgi:glycosyltransferase involved in cell wall biosynthesis|nr:glycosyltransferase [Nostoc indistinguendum CM1-VF10]